MHAALILKYWSALFISPSPASIGSFAVTLTGHSMLALFAKSHRSSYVWNTSNQCYSTSSIATGQKKTARTHRSFIFKPQLDLIRMQAVGCKAHGESCLFRKDALTDVCEFAHVGGTTLLRFSSRNGFYKANPSLFRTGGLGACGAF
jgi:hypothetical protein